MRNKLGQFVKGNIPQAAFQKGLVPWNKGLTAKENDKIAKSVKAAHEARRGIAAWNQGLGISKKKIYVTIDGQKAIRIPLTKGKFAIIDEEDFQRVNQFKWHVTISAEGRCYAKTSFWINGKNQDLKMHRFIVGLRIGQRYPLLDHKNGNGLDNRKINLRKATKNQNTQNSIQPNKNGFKGIYKNHNKYAARIKFNGRLIRRYGFDTPQEAAKYYDYLARKYFGEFAKTNF